MKLFSNFSGNMIFFLVWPFLLEFFKLPEIFIWLFEFQLLIVIFNNIDFKTIKQRLDITTLLLIGAFLTILFIGFIRGISDADSYFRYKNVFKQLFMDFFYFQIILSANYELIFEYLGLYKNWLLLFLFLSFFFVGNFSGLDYMPFLLLGLFFSINSLIEIIIILTLGIFIIFSLEHRNDILKMVSIQTINLLLLLSVRWKLRSKIIINLGILFFIFSPFVFLFLGVSGVYNIFKFGENAGIEGELLTKQGSRDLSTDTRTMIYENVFQTLGDKSSILFGVNTAHGDTYFNLDEYNYDDQLDERFGNEVGVLDILLWYGIVGLLLYFAIFARAIYLATTYSNNVFVKYLALIIAFQWFMSFIWEKPMISTFYFIDLAILGLCLSKRFRSLTDIEVKEIFKNFVKK